MKSSRKWIGFILPLVVIAFSSCQRGHWCYGYADATPQKSVKEVKVSPEAATEATPKIEDVAQP